MIDTPCSPPAPNKQPITKAAKPPKIDAAPEMTADEALSLLLTVQRDTPFKLFRPYDDAQAAVLKNLKRRIAVLGPNRQGKCVAADTLVSGRRMDSFGFVKGIDQLWDLDGRLRATASHRVLAPSGWTSVSELLQREQDQRHVYVEFRPDSNWEHDLLVQLVNDPHSWQTLEDFQSGYLSYFHSNGGQPRKRLACAPDGSPLPDDVPAGTFSHQYEQEYNHFYPPSYHLSNSHGVLLDYPSIAVEDQEDKSFSSQSLLHTQDIPLSALSSELTTKVLSAIQDQNVSSQALPTSFTFVYWPQSRTYTFAIKTNINISMGEVQEFYDTSIPITHAYSAGGLISHNTTIGTYWLLCHLTGEYPEQFPEHMKFEQPIRARIIIEEYKEHGPVLVAKLKALANKGFVKKWYKNPQGYVTGFDCRNGSRVSILTHEQSTDSHEGWDGHVVWADEPLPKDKFIANTRGLVDNLGQFLMTMTPLKEPWISDEIYEENPQYWNVINLGAYANPYISKEALDEFYASVDPDQLGARKYGKFIHLVGAIYGAFSKQRHVVPSQKLPAEWPRFMVVDPHDRRPFAMGWYAIDPMDRLWVYDEYPNSMFHKITNTDLKIGDYATIIRNKEGKVKIAKRIIDRRYGYTSRVQSGTTIQQDLNMDYDLFFNPSYDDKQGGIEAGHIAVKEYLGTSSQEPRMFIMEHCTNHVYAMTHYIYDEKTGKPKEHGKDFADLVRYMAKDGATYDNYADNPTPEIAKIQNRQGMGEIVETSEYQTATQEY